MTLEDPNASTTFDTDDNDIDLDNSTDEPNDELDNSDDSEPNEDDGSDKGADDKDKTDGKQDKDEIPEEFKKKFLNEKGDIDIEKMLKSSYNLEQKLGKRESEAIAAKDKEIARYQTILKNTVGVESPEQAEIVFQNEAVKKNYRSVQKELATKKAEELQPYSENILELREKYEKGEILDAQMAEFEAQYTKKYNEINRKYAREELELDESLKAVNKNIIQQQTSGIKTAFMSELDSELTSQPEEARTEIKAAFDLLFDDFTNAGQPIDRQLLKETKQKTIDFYNKAYQAGLKAGQLAVKNTDAKKKLTGLPDNAGSKSSANTKNPDFDTFKTMSKEDKIKYITS